MKTVHAKPSQVPRYVSFESIEFTDRLNSRVEFACETNRYFIQTACSLPVILTPYRSNLRRLLPFSVSPLFPCRTPNSLSVAHDKAPLGQARANHSWSRVLFSPIISISILRFFFLLPSFPFKNIERSYRVARRQIG